MHDVGRSVLQFVLDLSTINEDLPMMLRVAENTKIPVSFSITQNDKAPQRWRQTLDTSTMPQRAACRSRPRSPPARSG